jgi:hypothetical protein
MRFDPLFKAPIDPLALAPPVTASTPARNTHVPAAATANLSPYENTTMGLNVMMG